MTDEESVKYSISPELIKFIPFSKYENNFVFIVNNKKHYTNRVCADILSPIVRNFHYVDESINEYSFDVDEEIDLFSEFLQLFPFNDVELDQKHIQCFSKYFIKLGNIIEYININSSIFEKKDEDYFINIFFDLYQKYSTAMPSELIQAIHELFAGNFYKIQDNKDLRYFDLDFLEGIISSPSLTINDEDSLLNCILDLYEDDQKYSRLFEYVYFSSVGEKTLHRFFETFSQEDINQSLWQSIISIFLQNEEQNKIKQNRYIKKIENKNRYKKNNNDPKDMKVIFLGDTDCGKTTIIFDILNKNTDDIWSTVSTNRYSKKIQNTNLTIYDTPGQEKFKSLLPILFRDMDVFVIVYDVNQEKDVNSYLDEYIQFINDNIYDNHEIFIVCNKIDLQLDFYWDNEVNNEKIENGRKFAKEHNYHFITTSAKESFGIDQLFDEIAQLPLQTK